MVDCSPSRGLFRRSQSPIKGLHTIKIVRRDHVLFVGQVGVAIVPNAAATEEEGRAIFALYAVKSGYLIALLRKAGIEPSANSVLQQGKSNDKCFQNLCFHC